MFLSPARFQETQHGPAPAEVLRCRSALRNGLPANASHLPHVQWKLPARQSCDRFPSRGPHLPQQKWLRETKNLHIEIYRNACGYGYIIVKANNGTWMKADGSKGPNDGGKWDAYEEALEAGIFEALKLI